MSGFINTPYGIEIRKDPNAILDYSLMWTDRLESGVTIASAAWTIPAGLTQVSSSVNGGPITFRERIHPAGTVTTVRLSGGSDGTRYRCVCRATLSTGEIDDQSIFVEVREK
jgi:hypothetical protein